MLRGRSGISPVVATVILVAIAIVIAIAVAFWATGLVGIFTRYEKLEITSAFSQNTGPNQYTINIVARNTGSSSATIDQVLLNGVPVCGIQATGWGPTGQNPPGFNILGCPAPQATTLDPGESTGIQVNVQAPAPGIAVEVAVHTASGKLYPYSVLLP